MQLGHRLKLPAASVIAVLLVACGPVPAVLEPASAESLQGTASVIDGDTLEIHGERVRLSGIDTPERGKRCGTVNVYQQAALALSDMIGSRTVSCTILETDRYDRKVGRCAVSGAGLEAAMVRAGWARDWPRYSDGEFAADERAARQAGAGIWGLDCPDDLWGDRNYE